MLKTKIVCTLGPASDDPDILRGIIDGGMDVARFNFSHGTHAEQLERVTLMRDTAAQSGVDIAAMMDTKGPEVRLGTFSGGAITLLQGQDFTLTTEPIDCDETRASVSYSGMTRNVVPGTRILIDDGLIALDAVSVTDTEIKCTVINGGVVSGRKGINVPGVELGLPAVSEQDRLDLLFAVEHDFDFIAVSFVRKKDDISMVRRILDENGGTDIKLIAKIESREGLENLAEIIAVSDGIMVARGDLGVEIPVEEVPIVQKAMIQSCLDAGKPVITATQMLDSMQRNPRPTRAEATDIANAIYDGTSAIMLSGETASGLYPVESVQTMVKIAETAEKSIDYRQLFNAARNESSKSMTDAIGHATCATAMDLGAAAIVAVTTGGYTASAISGFRPQTPIIAATTSMRVMRQMRLHWGVTPYHAERVDSTDELFEMAVNAAIGSKMALKGDLVVVTAGVPLGVSGTTNMLKVQKIE